MVRNIGKREGNGGGAKLEGEIDDLFRLPLAEFTGARNTLSARLKKEGRANDAERVKLLGKPPVSAWAVNQLYWDHRDAFDDLIATGKRLRPAQKSRPERSLLPVEGRTIRKESGTSTSSLGSPGVPL